MLGLVDRWRTGTAYFAWFFEGVYQFVKKEGLYSTQP